MCYSAMIRQNAQKYYLTFDVRQQRDLNEEWEFRVFPHLEFPVVLELQGERTVQSMYYSLIPKWSKERKPRFATYNARVETLCEKATWRTPIQSQRCLVGLTSFFESCYQGSHAGNVVEFSERQGEVLAAAGIYEEWTDPQTGEIVPSFAMITTSSRGFIKDVGHDRSPIFLPNSHFDQWLSPSKVSCIEAKSFLLESGVQPEFSVQIERPLKPGWEKRRPG